VFFRGNTPEGTTFDVRYPSAKSGAAFFCKHCPGVSPVGDVEFGSPERNAFVQFHDRGLQSVLRGTPLEDHDAVTELYDRGELFSEIAAAARRRRAQQTAVRSHPRQERKLERCWSYLIWRYEQRGTQEKAIEDLLALHDTDRDYYAEIVGTTWPLRPGTLQDYLKQLPPEIKKDARDTYFARRAAERDRRPPT
jgi:hypothetical protein